MRVVIVGAGLGGLSCALHLAADHEVVVLEREAVPGGRAGRLTVGEYQFDTGPTVLTMPSVLAQALGAVGEQLSDWLDLTELDPAYRAFFADGSSLDVMTDPQQMSAYLGREVGLREADGYRQFVAYASKLWELERADFIERNFDSPRDLLTMNLLRLAAAGGFGRLQTRIDRFFTDPRLRRLFSFQALYAGVSPHQALALYLVISYLDTVAGVFHPVGGMHAVPQALAGAAQKHGVTFHYDTTVTRVETVGDRAVAVHTADGERIAADAVVLNPDLPIAYESLLGERARKLRYSPSCVVVHLGTSATYPQLAHHNIHFGHQWRRTFDEIIRDGRLMSDPSLFVTTPSPGVYYLLAPVPNLDMYDPNWATFGDRYADSLIAHLEERGYPGLAASTEVRAVVTPADWLDQGMAAGTPFAAAHTFRQTGPFRPGNRHPRLSNVVFAGSGTQPGVGVPMVMISGKLAAERVRTLR